jgi:hypothetical protein
MKWPRVNYPIAGFRPPSSNREVHGDATTVAVASWSISISDRIQSKLFMFDRISQTRMVASGEEHIYICIKWIVIYRMNIDYLRSFLIMIIQCWLYIQILVISKVHTNNNIAFICEPYMIYEHAWMSPVSPCKDTSSSLARLEG